MSNIDLRNLQVFIDEFWKDDHSFLLRWGKVEKLFNFTVYHCFHQRGCVRIKDQPYHITEVGLTLFVRITPIGHTLGLLLAIYVTPADLHESRGARCLLAGLAPLLPRLKKIWADAAYRGQELAAWCKAEGGWDLEIVERTPSQRGFSIQPRRWGVERSFSWLSRNRRLSKGYERKVQSSETFFRWH